MAQEASVSKMIQEEYGRFRCEMLKLSNEELFEQCSRVRFYSCLNEYFMYNENIPQRILDLAGSGAFSICGAWLFYLKHEAYGCETWEAISEMILAMYKKRGWRVRTYGIKRINNAVC